jgi:hypothetical protein
VPQTFGTERLAGSDADAARRGAVGEGDAVGEVADVGEQVESRVGVGDRQPLLCYEFRD